MRRYITGWSGNSLNSYIVEETDTCPTCGGSGQVDIKTCWEWGGCIDSPHPDECPCREGGDDVPCPQCGGAGSLTEWH